MKTNNFGKLAVLTAGVMALGLASVASAETVRHEFMDIKAAKADIARLKVERRFANKVGDWGKVAQDDRLIAEDRYWIRKDELKIRYGG